MSKPVLKIEGLICDVRNREVFREEAYILEIGKKIEEKSW